MTDEEFIVRLRLVGVTTVAIERMLASVKYHHSRRNLELWVQYSEEGTGERPGSAYVQALNKTWGREVTGGNGD